ncbi:prepilin peptidase [Corynebacterium ulcerans]|uniref:prepilin peptidase n=1 Tax=Corynebacterium ulcerans TaxID=65058 RepID=UPI000C758811|nr:A24 family peptidase [Corynebacterium ulcerans]PLW00386.1 prepilin peptidase [Corynebacterium ulcerans]
MGEHHSVLMLKEYSDAAVVLVVVAWAGGLCLYDVLHRTLPDVLTIPVAIGIVVGSVAVGQPGWLLGGMMWAGMYLLLGLTWQGVIGGGDIKLALTTGTIAAMHSPLAVVCAMTTAQLVTLFAGVIMSFYRKLHSAQAWGEKMKDRSVEDFVQQCAVRIPHGPAMLLATAFFYMVTP